MRLIIPSFLLLLFFCKTASSQTFSVVDSLPVGAYGTAAWGDFDGDHYKDLAYISQTVTMGEPDVFIVYRGGPNGLTPLTQPFTHLFNPAAKWGDLDNDGNEDLVVSGLLNNNFNEVLQIFKSNGDGTFTLKNDTLPGMSVGSIDIADYDNDGLKDIAASGIGAGSDYHTYIFRNKGNWEFEDIHANLTGAIGGELKWCDYDNDGKQDIALSGLGMNSSRTWIYHNDGNNNFSLTSPYMKGGAGTLDWIDYNGDNFKDLLVAGVDSSGAHNFTDLYHNNGDGTFTKQTTFNAARFGEPVATDIADFNGDGKPDIFFGGGNDSFFINYTAIGINNGTPAFNFNASEKLDIQNCIVAAADYDNDGDQDLLISNFLYRNDGVASVQNTKTQIASVSPNPASSKIEILTKADNAEVSLISLSGILVYQRKIEHGKQLIDVASLAEGSYFLLIKNKAQRQVEKIIVQH